MPPNKRTAQSARAELNLRPRNAGRLAARTVRRSPQQRTQFGLVLYRVRRVGRQETDADGNEHGDARARVAGWGPAR